MLAPEDLVVQALRAVVVAKVEARVPVLVPDHKLDTHVTRSRAHSFQLKWGVVSREHSAIAVACVIDEAAGFLWSRFEALARRPRRYVRHHSWVAYLLVGPACSIPEALGFDVLDAKGEHASNGSEN